MTDNTNRRFVRHVSGMFQSAILNTLAMQLSVLHARETDSLITEREKNAVNRGESVDSVRMRALWYDVWKRPVLRDRMLDSIFPFQYVIFPCQVRWIQNTGQHYVPWHQDIAYIRLLGSRAHEQVMTCFVPLEPDPGSVTTIQFAIENPAIKEDHLYSHAAQSGFGAGIQLSEFEDAVHYKLDHGDSLLFGDHTVHRTFLPENCSVLRRSLEFRLVRAEHLVCGKDYFDTENLSFVKFTAGRELIPWNCAEEESVQ